MTYILYIIKDELISEIYFGILYIVKQSNVSQIFFFNLVKRNVRLFTSKQEFLSNIIAFKVFQAMSEFEETWRRTAENLIKLCFVAFLSNKSKKCFILV